MLKLASFAPIPGVQIGVHISALAKEPKEEGQETDRCRPPKAWSGSMQRQDSSDASTGQITFFALLGIVLLYLQHSRWYFCMIVGRSFRDVLGTCTLQLQDRDLSPAPAQRRRL